jgi:hypothetical protein
MQLEAVLCEPCQNDRDGHWCRVWTFRGAEARVSDLSWALARRIVPRLLAMHGAEVPPGLFNGGTALVR